MKSISVLTTIEANHGSCVFDYSLNTILKKFLPSHQVRFIKYQPWRRAFNEFLRTLKPNMKIPLYNILRYQRLMTFEYENLGIDRIPYGPYSITVNRLIKKQYDVIIAGKVIWDLTHFRLIQKFPNLFWLSEKIPAVKIAYAVSGHRTNMDMLKKIREDVKRILCTYALIGVRDDLTMQMMVEAGVDKHVTVLKVPDPAFMYEAKPLDMNFLLKKYNITTDRPIIGLLLFGKPELSAAVCRHYRAKGYQIVNFNMFNPFVDINLGHLIDPFEWAALFKSLTFCITDRFHCSVFCIKYNIPFVAIEPYEPRTLLNSKVYDLLKEFGLTECYQNTYAPEFDLPGFLSVCVQIEDNWQTDFHDRVAQKAIEGEERNKAFIKLIQELI